MSRGRWRADVVTWDDLEQDLDSSEDPFFNDYLILAEGDSWFTIGAIPSSNLLFSMRFNRSTLIVNCAYPGDTIRRMSSLVSDPSFQEALSYQNTYHWGVILLSGGGNDLIDKAGSILLPKNKRRPEIKRAADYFNQEAFDSIKENIKVGYKKLAAYRNAAKPHIVVHTYDYATPRDSPARFFRIGRYGPWIAKALKKRGVPEQDWIMVGDYLIDQLADTILSLGKGTDKIPNFHVVDTRGVLHRAKLNKKYNSGDWLNEIHPNNFGYEKIAKVMEPQISRLLESQHSQLAVAQ